MYYRRWEDERRVETVAIGGNWHFFLLEFQRAVYCRCVIMDRGKVFSEHCSKGCDGR
jgi:hypothetical protein